MILTERKRCDKCWIVGEKISLFLKKNQSLGLEEECLNCSWRDEEEFLKNFETQKFLLEASKKYCEEKNIELILFPRGTASIEDSVLSLKKILEEKLPKNK